MTCTLQNADGGLQAEGQAKVRLESSGLSLFPESPESGGGELMVTYRNISDFSVGDYRISLLADGPYAGFFVGYSKTGRND